MEKNNKLAYIKIDGEEYYLWRKRQGDMHLSDGGALGGIAMLGNNYAIERPFNNPFDICKECYREATKNSINKKKE